MKYLRLLFLIIVVSFFIACGSGGGGGGGNDGDSGGNNSGASTTTATITDPQLLIGKWHFEFTIISKFTEEYTLTEISGDKNSEGGYCINGTNQYGGFVNACYWPNSGYWALLNQGTIIDKFYTFYTDGKTILQNSCYYQIDKNNNWSSCFTLSGYKMSNLSSSGVISFLSQDIKESHEQLAVQEAAATNVLIEDSIAQKYLIMKSLGY